MRWFVEPELDHRRTTFLQERSLSTGGAKVHSPVGSRFTLLAPDTVQMVEPSEESVPIRVH